MPNIIFLVFRRMRAPLVLLVAVYAISILGLVLIPGMDNEGKPWKMDFFHAFYFVSFMGTTIGFGEVPYPFTDAQRLWTLVTIYGTVIAWLYGIGTLLSLIQSPSFSLAVEHRRFIRRVKRIREPYYIVCGYGDTGKLLVNSFMHTGQRIVVIDKEIMRIDELNLEDYPLYVPGIAADAEDANILQQAGIERSNCKGLISVTRSDATNLKIAISAKILNPQIKVISRAETQDVCQNLESFGTDLVVNPYDVFAEDFVLALKKPSMFLLEQWITAAANSPLTEPVFPPRGRWILCGYGRFGKAMHKQLLAHGNPVTVVEAKPRWTQAPTSTIKGRGTEAVTLQEADIRRSVGLIAGTNNDVNNLSIVLTGQQLKPKVFTILRQQSATNDHISRAMQPDMLMHHSHIIASRILESLTTPLTGHFMRLARQESEEWARILISRVAGVVDDKVPEAWVLSVRKDHTTAIWDALRENRDVLIEDFMQSPRVHGRGLPCIPLLLQRKKQLIILPDPGSPLKFGDRILFCGQERAQRRMRLIATSPQLLHFTQTGIEKPAGWVWNLFTNRAGTLSRSKS